MNTIDFVLGAILAINLLLGIGNYFATDFADAFTLNIDNGNVTFIGINETAYNTTIENVETSPTLSNVMGIGRMALTILFGIPSTILWVGTGIHAPVALIGFIVASTTGIMLMIYGFFLLRIISFFTGGSS